MVLQAFSEQMQDWLQGYLVHKKQPPPQDRHMALETDTTVGSYGGDVSYERGTPVLSFPQHKS